MTSCLSVVVSFSHQDMQMALSCVAAAAIKFWAVLSCKEEGKGRREKTEEYKR
jgi:hypothetical protein